MDEPDFSVEAMECIPSKTTPGTLPTTAHTSTRDARSGGGRPAVYRLPDGTRVPSITTITKRFADSGGLVHWAHTQGLDGKSINESRDRAAGIGHTVHDAVETFVCGSTEEEARRLLDLDDEEDAAKAALGFDAFMRWWQGYRPAIIATEQPLVHEGLRFGGTLDAIGRVGCELCVIDWKTSGSIYSDYATQVEGYRVLWEEGCWMIDGEWQYPGAGQRISGYHILRFSKASGGFEHRYFPAATWQPVREHLLHLLRAYESDKKVKALLR